MKRLRYARYIRVSDPRQKDGYSIDAQLSTTEKYIEREDGLLVETYIDDGISATTTHRRDEFHRMRADAQRGLFDVLVVHKFDRLARNRLDAATTKLMLRKDCGIKVLSASGEPSADLDPLMGGLIEAIMEAMAEWYSVNLGQEVKKSRLEMLEQQIWYGAAPFGYLRDPDTGILVPDPAEAPIIKEIFAVYGAGGVGIREIAKMLNKRGLRTRQYENRGGVEWSKNTIRRILVSRTYLGELPYQPLTKNSSGKRTFEMPVEWRPGTHQPLVTQELYDKCQLGMKRNARNVGNKAKSEGRYLLDGLCFCAICQQKHGADHITARMLSKTWFRKGHEYPYYTCKDSENPHGNIRVDKAEAELINFLLSGRLVTDIDGRDKTVAAIAADFETAAIQERIDEIKARINRMDFRFDHGAFIGDPQEFLTERQKLEDEITILQTRIGAGYEYALSVLNNFPDHWAATQDFQERRSLIRAVVSKVIVLNRHVMGVTVRPSNEIIILRAEGVEPGQAGVGVWPLPDFKSL